MNGDGENVAGFDGMGGFYNLDAVEADMTFFNEAGREGAVLDDAGKPQPFVQTLGQVQFPVILALRAASAAKGESGSMGFSGFLGFSSR